MAVARNPFGFGLMAVTNELLQLAMFRFVWRLIINLHLSTSINIATVRNVQVEFGKLNLVGTALEEIIR
jgi:hypothetical protein